MEKYGRDWCIHSYTKVAGVLANFSLNSRTVLPVWCTFPTRCDMDGFFNFSICCSITWDGIVDDNEHLGSGRPFLGGSYTVAILTKPSSRFHSLTKLASSEHVRDFCYRNFGAVFISLFQKFMHLIFMVADNRKKKKKFNSKISQYTVCKRLRTSVLFCFT